MEKNMCIQYVRMHDFWIVKGSLDFQLPVQSYVTHVSLDLHACVCGS